MPYLDPDEPLIPYLLGYRAQQGGESADETAPTAAVLSDPAPGDTTLTVTYTDGSDAVGITSRVIRWGTATGTYTQSRALEAGELSAGEFTLTGLTNATEVFVIVEVDDAAGTGPTASNEVSGTPGTLILDTFTGANGTTLMSHGPDVGGAWAGTLNNPNGQLQGNQLQLTVNSGGAHIDAGASDVDIRVDWVLDASTTAQRNSIIVRYLDGDFWLVNFRLLEGDVSIQEFDNPTLTMRAAASHTFTAGATHAIRVTAVGSVITVYVDDAEVVSYASAAFLQSQTRHGLYRNSGSSLTRFDNFRVYVAV